MHRWSQCPLSFKHSLTSAQDVLWHPRTSTSVHGDPSILITSISRTCASTAIGNVATFSSSTSNTDSLSIISFLLLTASESLYFILTAVTFPFCILANLQSMFTFKPNAHFVTTNLIFSTIIGMANLITVVLCCLSLSEIHQVFTFEADLTLTGFGSTHTGKEEFLVERWRKTDWAAADNHRDIGTCMIRVGWHTWFREIDIGSLQMHIHPRQCKLESMTQSDWPGNGSEKHSLVMSYLCVKLPLQVHQWRTLSHKRHVPHRQTRICRELRFWHSEPRASWSKQSLKQNDCSGLGFRTHSCTSAVSKTTFHQICRAETRLPLFCIQSDTRIGTHYRIQCHLRTPTACLHLWIVLVVDTWQLCIVGDCSISLPLHSKLFRRLSRWRRRILCSMNTLLVRRSSRWWQKLRSRWRFEGQGHSRSL